MGRRAGTYDPLVRSKLLGQLYDRPSRLTLQERRSYAANKEAVVYLRNSDVDN